MSLRNGRDLSFENGGNYASESIQAWDANVHKSETSMQGMGLVIHRKIQVVHTGNPCVAHALQRWYPSQAWLWDKEVAAEG